MNAEAAVQNYLYKLNYSIDVRPLYNSSLPIVVWMAVRVLKIVDFSSEERLSIMASIMTSWVDEFLRWDPEKFDGVNFIYRRANTIWRSSPFTLWNAGGSSVYYEVNGSHPITVEYDGTVSVSITSVYVVICEMDVTYFPWDTQQCQIQVKATVMDLNRMIIKPIEGISLFQSDPSNSEWSVNLDSAHHYTSNVSVYIAAIATDPTKAYQNMSIYYLNLTLSRIPTFYLSNVIAPVCIITALSLFSYFVPGNSGERIGLTVSAFLSFSVFQSYVNNFVPRSATIPMISAYILSQMVLSAICVLSGVITLMLCESKRPMPVTMRRILHLVAKLLHIYTGETANTKPATEMQNVRKSRTISDSVANSLPNYEVQGVRALSFKSTSCQLSNLEELAEGSDGDAATTGELPKKTNCSETVTPDSKQDAVDWKILNEVLDRIFLVLCMFSIVFLTVYFLTVMQAQGTATQF